MDQRPHTPPAEPTRGTPHLTRDERRDILLMASLHHTEEEIAAYLSDRYGKQITLRQISYTLQTEKATPRKPTGRPAKLTREQGDVLEAYVTTSHETRRMSYEMLARNLQFPNIGRDAIRRELNRRGYSRRIALRKPPLDERTKVIRLEWAREHLHWSEEQWWKILWSDETWVTGGTHRKVWITRRPGEELHPHCIIPKVQRKAGWMFWGCFAGKTKGPSLFWEKEWGTIGSESYIQHIIPLVEGWIKMNPGLVFMQDNAPGHRAAETRAELYERSILIIFWPAFSPDLNPIEYVWNLMKDWIASHYPTKMNYDQLRIAVKEAWEAVAIEELTDLVRSMKDRCQAVIDARGGHIPY